MPENPMLTMMVAVRSHEEPRAMREQPLNLVIDSFRSDEYLSIHTGAFSILLNRYEARALGIAIGELSEQATSLGSAREHVRGGANRREEQCPPGP